jgi:DNA topoisomerase-3
MQLVICEKPSQAQSIAAVLKATQRQDGYLQGGEWLVSWCLGHLGELAPADAYGGEYKRWSRDALPIVPERWKYEASKSKTKQLAVLRGLMSRTDVESVVCATDSGREGELIFRLVYGQCKCQKPVRRLWVSSMEDSDIREGFDKLRPGADYDNLYRSALCRARADWLVGINITRLFSCLYGSFS